jgi:predicted RNA-binding Zn ribbon-like protein
VRMETLDLDPAGYTGTYKLIGGRLALNFINTMSWPDTERGHDWLSSVANVQRWANAVDLNGRQLRSADLDAIKAARTVITQLIRPLTHGQLPAKAEIDEFNNTLSSTSGRRALDPATLAWTWRHQTPLEAFLDPIVLNAADVASAQDRSRLGHCPTCDWVFHDDTRNGARRWCDMADCGSRSKSRRYYQRTHT